MRQGTQGTNSAEAGPMNKFYILCVGSRGVYGPEGARKLFSKNKAKIPARLNKIYSTKKKKKTVMCKKEKNKA